jgi:hypothetical protein
MDQYLQLKQHPELKSLLESLCESMLDYMNEAGAIYNAQDVRNCEMILDEYIKAIIAAEDELAYLGAVKDTVLELNELNKKADHGLIETMEREMIADYIIKSGQQLGFNQGNEDITEPWREW